jgi:hypothetical protein
MNMRMIAMVATIVLLGGAVGAGAQAAERTPSGVWVGTLTSRDMESSGRHEQPVELVVKEDGKWVMKGPGWQSSGTITSRTQSYVMEGNFMSGEKPAGMALYYLSDWGDNAMGGNASSQYKGNHITTGIVLKRVQ